MNNVSQGHHLHSYFNQSMEVTKMNFSQAVAVVWCSRGHRFFPNTVWETKKWVHNQELKLPKVINSHVTPFSPPASLSHIAMLPCWSPWSSAPAFRPLPGKWFQIIQWSNAERWEACAQQHGNNPGLSSQHSTQAGVSFLRALTLTIPFGPVKHMEEQ